MRKIPMPVWMKDQKGAVTPECAKALEDQGIAVPDWVKIASPGDDAIKGAVYVCMRHYEGRDLILRDNLVDKCGWCGHGIQHTANAPAGMTRICMVCAEAKATSQEN